MKLARKKLGQIRKYRYTLLEESCQFKKFASQITFSIHEKNSDQRNLVESFITCIPQHTHWRQELTAFDETSHVSMQLYFTLEFVHEFLSCYSQMNKISQCCYRYHQWRRGYKNVTV